MAQRAGRHEQHAHAHAVPRLGSAQYAAELGEAVGVRQVLVVADGGRTAQHPRESLVERAAARPLLVGGGDLPPGLLQPAEEGALAAARWQCCHRHDRPLVLQPTRARGSATHRTGNGGPDPVALGGGGGGRRRKRRGWQPLDRLVPLRRAQATKDAPLQARPHALEPGAPLVHLPPAAVGAVAGRQHQHQRRHARVQQTAARREVRGRNGPWLQLPAAAAAAAARERQKPAPVRGQVLGR
mmetsp:Transcript_46464/g.149603  ORF Transcript_46464/g.149603 Transcript_46464/m.149603 type:complete len:241 (+) Transcript_46464:276-998(+)